MKPAVEVTFLRSLRRGTSFKSGNVSALGRQPLGRFPLDQLLGELYESTPDFLCRMPVYDCAALNKIFLEALPLFERAFPLRTPPGSFSSCAAERRCVASSRAN